MFTPSPNRSHHVAYVHTFAEVDAAVRRLVFASANAVCALTAHFTASQRALDAIARRVGYAAPMAPNEPIEDREFTTATWIWRKVEDEKDVFWETINKPLKSLALPRGIEPLFQP